MRIPHPLKWLKFTKVFLVTHEYIFLKVEEILHPFEQILTPPDHYFGSYGCFYTLKRERKIPKKLAAANIVT